MNSSEVYPTYFGVSCAFAALLAMSKMKKKLDLENSRWSHVAELMLRGSVDLLRLLIDEAQRTLMEEKLKNSEADISELKLRRAEDAKANEKVVSIFAAHEQAWISERKRLSLQIQALDNELRNVRAVNGDKQKLIEEADILLRDKEKVLEEEAQKRRVAEEEAERERKAAEEQSVELRKHKTAVAEFASSLRQMEAELRRAKAELGGARDREEKAAAELAKLRRDTEQKDKILSAMLRKSKLDTAEKQVLLKEVQMATAKKDQAELEVERWKGSKNNKRSSNRDLHYLEAGCSHEQLNNGGYNDRRILLLEYLEAESRNERPMKVENKANYSNHHLSKEGNDEPDFVEVPMDDIPQLKEWVRIEAERYAAILEQRHYEEIEAFTEQMRLRDDKLEMLTWQLLSMDLESKRLQSHIEGLDGSLSQLREENLRLEELLIEKEKEIKSVNDQLSVLLQYCQRSNIDPNYQALRSEIKITRRKSTEKDNESKIKLVEVNENIDKTLNSIDEKSLDEFERRGDYFGEKEQIEERVVSIDPANITTQNNTEQCNYMRKDPAWRKMDIHALGVSYKIKRLKQQVVVLEKLIEQQTLKQQTSLKDDECRSAGSTETRKADDKHINGLVLVMSLLNKQVQRYESLEEKTDDLCKRRHENSRSGSRSDLSDGRRKEQKEVLQRFLEETFQLQRLMVATGQKLMEVQSRIASNFVCSSKCMEESAGINIGQFADLVRTLFREIQRGLEVRIARIIGDLEGTLASDGILR